MATTAGAVVAKARRDVLSHFMQVKAVDAGSASRWIPERRIQRRVLDRMVRQGVLVETDGDTYYLDFFEFFQLQRLGESKGKVDVVVTIGSYPVGSGGLAARRDDTFHLRRH